MAQPGWYADPTAPQGRRYWDGTRWADPPAPGAGQPKKGPSRWLWLVLSLVIIGSIVGAMVLFPRLPTMFAATPEDTRTARPTGTQWNELEPSDTPTPTAVETGFGQPIDCPYSGDDMRSEIRDNRISGGGLSIERPPGSEWFESPAYIDWMYDSNSIIRNIAPGWISNVGVGYIKVSDGFSKQLNVAAEQFVTCMASSGMFRSFEKREVLWNEDYLVSDRIGWRLTSKIYVTNMLQHDIEGDVVEIIMVPTDDDDKIAVYVSCATIDHEQNLEQVQVSLESLRWDG